MNEEEEADGSGGLQESKASCSLSCFLLLPPASFLFILPSCSSMVEQGDVMTSDLQDAGAKDKEPQEESKFESEQEVKALDNKLDSLKDLALTLLGEIETLGTPDITEGIDFYDAIRRFEISLIERALAHTYGSQTRAAQLLNLNVQTLNNKIKQHQIDVERFKGE